MSEETKEINRLVGDVLLGGAVVVNADSMVAVMKQIRLLDDEPHKDMAAAIFSTPEVLRGIEHGRQYVQLPLIFRYLDRLGLQLKLEKRPDG